MRLNPVLFALSRCKVFFCIISTTHADDPVQIPVTAPLFSKAAFCTFKKLILKITPIRPLYEGLFGRLHNR
jgi:hypothetical protein